MSNIRSIFISLLLTFLPFLLMPIELPKLNSYTIIIYIPFMIYLTSGLMLLIFSIYSMYTGKPSLIDT